MLYHSCSPSCARRAPIAPCSRGVWREEGRKERGGRVSLRTRSMDSPLSSLFCVLVSRTPSPANSFRFSCFLLLMCYPSVSLFHSAPVSLHRHPLFHPPPPPSPQPRRPWPIFYMCCFFPPCCVPIFLFSLSLLRAPLHTRILAHVCARPCVCDRSPALAQQS